MHVITPLAEMGIVVPKRWVSVSAFWNEQVIRPLFFLAGPIRGGGDWQAAMCCQLALIKWLPSFIAACPCRWDESHLLGKHLLAGHENFFDRQLPWERHYLELAGLHRNPGCIIFYLPQESEEEPHPGPEPYAMDTRAELGEWRMRMKYEGARVVIGADPAFHGLSQIQRNFSDVLGYDFPIVRGIAETARAAVAMALQR